jgi:integrase
VFDASAFGSHVEKVLEFLQSKSVYNRKTRLAILIVALEALDKDRFKDAIDEYRFNMTEDAKEADEEDANGTLTTKQSKVYQKWSHFVGITNRMEKSVKPLLTMKESLTPEEIGRVQDYVIASLYTRIPPRRLKDYADMRLKNVDREKDNYAELGRKPQFVFNSYKTAKIHGTQSVELPKDLVSLLKKWLAMNKSESLLIDSKGNAMTVPKLNITLSRIFDGASVNILRHSYISDKLANMPKLKEMQELAEDMGHTVAEQLKYRVN